MILGGISNSETAVMKCSKMSNNMLDIKGGIKRILKNVLSGTVTVLENCQAANTEGYQKKSMPHLKCCLHETDIEEGRSG